jgi:tRNA 2-thiocytidine biosynthesis protein TtcA
VYEICSGLGANTIAFGHTADDFCEALLRNALFTGRLSALPPITYSRDRQFRLIRPLVFVTEDITRAYAEARAVPLTPCDCSLRTGTVRRSLRGIFSELEKEYPHLKENMLSAMGNVDTKRLLDPRLLEMERAELFPILEES